MDGEAEFRARLMVAAGDADALAELTSELQSIEAPWVRPMRIRVAAERVKLRPPQASPNPAPVMQANTPWLTPFGLPKPDGRPLYRYRLSKEAFDSLGKHLRARAAVMRFHVVESDAALFVIWAAEWFRRAYGGGGEEWARLGAEIGLSCEQAQWRKLADRGLKFWRIPALKLNRTHHRLVAIARQGGFPLAALGDGSGNAKGWAASYLERLVGILLSDRFEDQDHALAHARALSEIIPRTWSNEGMVEICAELAAGIVRLRREAEAAGIGDGALALAWLDTHHKDWRDELPVAFDDAAAQALLGGLMRTRAIKGGGNAICARRLLAFEDGERREQLELLFDGTLASDDPRALQRLGEDWSRLRLYAAGALAQYIGGELGVAVAGEDGAWTVRPSISRTRYDVPFGVQAEIELRGDGVRVAGPFAVPRGSPLRGGLLVLREEGDGYVVEAAGSGAFRAEEVYLENPDDWQIEPRGEGSGAIECSRSAGRQLTRVWGEALVRSAGGDTYLIRTGQASDQRDRLLVIGNEPSGCRSMDGIRLVRGTPQLLVGNDSTFRAAGGDGWWRRESEKGWQRFSGALPSGLINFAWRDRDTGHVRATGAAIILPAEFHITRKLSGDMIDLSVMGWPAEITSTIGVPTGLKRWRVPVVPRDGGLPVLAFKQAGGPDARIGVALPQRAWIHDWQEGPIQRGGSISLALLHRNVARTDGRCTLMADLISRDGTIVSEGQASWIVEDELALATIRDDIAALLRPLGDISARVRLNFNDSHENYWYVSEFDHELRYENGRYVPSHAVAQERVRVMARSLTNPAAAPLDHGPYSLIDHRPIELPRLYGDWLIYLRSDDRVLSRPAFLRGASLVMPPSTLLGKAMAITDRPARLAALRDLGTVIATDPGSSRPIIREILDLALSLEGLPPATFDILGLVADQPTIGTLMLFAARESEVETIMRLPEGLPFAWPLVPRSAWEIAAHTQAETMFAAMPEAIAMIGETIGRRRQLIAEYDPALRPMFDLPTEVPSLREASNDFVTRSHDRISASAASPFRPKWQNTLPAWSVPPRFWRALDAPVAAAWAAQGRITLDAHHVRCVKDVTRSHPNWFAQGYAASLKEK